MQKMLMATRCGHGDAEAEPVLVDTDRPGVAVLVLDDGQRLILDAAELRAALMAHASRRSTGRRRAICDN